VLNVSGHFEAVGLGHVHIGDHEVRVHERDKPNRFLPRAGLSHQLEVIAIA